MVTLSDVLKSIDKDGKAGLTREDEFQGLLQSLKAAGADVTNMGSVRVNGNLDKALQNLGVTDAKDVAAFKALAVGNQKGRSGEELLSVLDLNSKDASGKTGSERFNTSFKSFYEVKLETPKFDEAAVTKALDGNDELAKFTLNSDKTEADKKKPEAVRAAVIKALKANPVGADKLDAKVKELVSAEIKNQNPPVVTVDEPVSASNELAFKPRTKANFEKLSKDKSFKKEELATLKDPKTKLDGKEGGLGARIAKALGADPKKVDWTKVSNFNDLSRVIAASTPVVTEEVEFDAKPVNEALDKHKGLKDFKAKYAEKHPKLADKVRANVLEAAKKAKPDDKFNVDAAIDSEIKKLTPKTVAVIEDRRIVSKDGLYQLLREGDFIDNPSAAKRIATLFFAKKDKPIEGLTMVGPDGRLTLAPPQKYTLEDGSVVEGYDTNFITEKLQALIKTDVYETTLNKKVIDTKTKTHTVDGDVRRLAKFSKDGDPKKVEEKDVRAFLTKLTRDLVDDDKSGRDVSIIQSDYFKDSKVKTGEKEVEEAVVKDEAVSEDGDRTNNQPRNERRGGGGNNRPVNQKKMTEKSLTKK